MTDDNDPKHEQEHKPEHTHSPQGPKQDVTPSSADPSDPPPQVPPGGDASGG